MPQLPPELLNFVGVAIQLIVAVSVSFVVALWVSLAIWTFRDIRARTRDLFSWLLAIVLVLALGPVGLMFYFLLRPRETLAVAYDRQLEEEALLRDITARRACSTCQTVTEPDWLLCPRCRTELRRKCADCAHPLELDWVACPYCTAPVGSNGKSAGIASPARPPMWVTEPPADPLQAPPAQPTPSVE